MGNTRPSSLSSRMLVNAVTSSLIKFLIQLLYIDIPADATHILNYNYMHSDVHAPSLRQVLDVLSAHGITAEAKSVNVSNTPTLISSLMHPLCIHRTKKSVGLWVCIVLWWCCIANTLPACREGWRVWSSSLSPSSRSPITRYFCHGLLLDEEL